MLNVNEISDGLLLADGDILRLCTQLFVPRLDDVVARRQRADLECAAAVAHGEVRMIEHAHIGVHPAVHVALEGNHDFGTRKHALELHSLDRLTGVELVIKGRGRVNIVQGRVAVQDYEHLADLHAEDVAACSGSPADRM